MKLILIALILVSLPTMAGVVKPGVYKCEGYHKNVEVMVSEQAVIVSWPSSFICTDTFRTSIDMLNKFHIPFNERFPVVQSISTAKGEHYTTIEADSKRGMVVDSSKAFSLYTYRAGIKCMRTSYSDGWVEFRYWMWSTLKFEDGLIVSHCRYDRPSEIPRPGRGDDDDNN